ncbi:uncharacterized protein PgNI_09688, partial [Pyricularia grisea]|uniref:Uncharacterized protein n=1 Tax=Pyricularia grisea TaxID=148305 RepID=A0A6P8AT87_PYRGI
SASHRAAGQKKKRTIAGEKELSLRLSAGWQPLSEGRTLLASRHTSSPYIGPRLTLEKLASPDPRLNLKRMHHMSYYACHAIMVHRPPSTSD